MAESSSTQLEMAESSSTQLEMASLSSAPSRSNNETEDNTPWPESQYGFGSVLGLWMVVGLQTL
ncbi:hypothetical protein COLO4_07162 [Corchorus olitorius]|uniref:Uncharacterized protein n=1 Tax=Corchorus olitorius TaxID=93759 RepID=A0A1R3KKN4_9ROSI|nr:hypothetical protein COLO4_07162 [Corchorus olitorius]